MLQCRTCEFYHENPDGSPRLACNPFGTIKEPECLVKWQLIQLTVLARSHQATLEMYERLAPLQERMFKQMEREIDEADEGERWKRGEDDDDEEDDDPPFRA